MVRAPGIHAVLAAAALGVLQWGCAQQAAPPGGPVDDTAPAIAATIPALLEVDVASDTPLTVTFSERVNRDLAEDAIVVRPSITWARREWMDDTLLLYPHGGWAEDTTYSVLFRTAITDGRQIPMKESALIVFATGSDVHAGRLAGTVRRLGLGAGSTLVFAFAQATADTSNVAIDEAIAVAEPDASGSFLLAGLPIGTPVEVGAFFDINENRRFDPARDLYCRARALVVPDSSGGPLDLDIPLVFADSPGSVRAVVVDSTCLILEGLTRHSAQRRDSLFAARDSLIELRATWEARIDSLLGAVVAPAGEPIDDSVVIPVPLPDDATPSPVSPNSLRVAAERLRSELAVLVVPNSTDIVAMGYLPEDVRADSIYCHTPLVLRFEALSDTTLVTDVAYERFEFDIAEVPVGAYRGQVWRDLIGDEIFDPTREPGTADPITIWVPPGEAGVVDTVFIRRPESERMP